MSDGPMTPGTSSTDTARGRVRLRYARAHGLYLRGPVTGEPYVFNPDAGTPVHERDAAALLETGLFERA